MNGLTAEEMLDRENFNDALNSGWFSNTGLANVGDSNTWGFNPGTFGAIAGGLQALSGIGNFFTGLQGLNLAKKQFNFQKGLANRNLANQAKIVNNSYDNAAQVAAGMIGSKDANGNYGFTRQDIIDDYARRAREQHVDGSPI